MLRPIVEELYSKDDPEDITRLISKQGSGVAQATNGGLEGYAAQNRLVKNNVNGAFAPGSQDRVEFSNLHGLTRTEMRKLNFGEYVDVV